MTAMLEGEGNFRGPPFLEFELNFMVFQRYFMFLALKNPHKNFKKPSILFLLPSRIPTKRGAINVKQLIEIRHQGGTFDNFFKKKNPL